MNMVCMVYMVYLLYNVHGLHGVHGEIGLHGVHGALGVQYLVYKGKIAHKEKHVCMALCTWFTTLRSQFM